MKSMRQYGKSFFVLGMVVAIVGYIVFAYSYVYADEDKSAYVFYKASTLYEKGQYEEAIAVYEQLIETGQESGNLYYNIANCYFKLDKIGFAILNYERARRFMPRDADLAANYAYAKTFVNEMVLDAEENIVRHFINGLFEKTSSNELAAIVLLLWCVFFGALMLVSLFPRQKKYIRLVLVTLICVTGLSSFALLERVRVADKEAIVITSEIPARFAPFERATTHFTLFEGGMVYIIQKKGTWVKVARSDGKIGWIPEEHLVRI